MAEEVEVISRLPRIRTPKTSYTFDYPEAIEFAEAQEQIFWTAGEISVDKDIQDMRVNLSESEAHGVTTVLKLFTLYELVAGKDYWLDRVMRRFPRPDIQRMATTFGFFELNVHAPFYNKINEALMLNTDEFYNSYIKDEELSSRMKFIGDMVSEEDDLLSLATFSLIEGVLLYSSFAFIKSFQTQGNNSLLNVVRGINFSVRDENLHSVGGAWLFSTLRKETLEINPKYDTTFLNERIIKAVEIMVEHEEKILDKVFSSGEMPSIHKQDLLVFVKSRANLCLAQLGIKGQPYQIEDNPVAKWFYRDINLTQFHDFFTGVGSGYNRDWDQSKFNWSTC